MDTLESRCQVLTQGLIELDRLRKNLPVSSTQFVAGRPSGKRANQILKELGIDTTRIDSDLDDYDAFSNGSPGAESLGGGGYDISPYEEGYPRDPREPAYPHSRHRSPGSSCSTSVDASSHHSWGQPEPHTTYAVPHGQLLQEQTSMSPTNLTPNREFVDPLGILEPVPIMTRRDSEYPAPSSPPPAFEYRPSYSHSSHDLSSGYQFYGMDTYQSAPIVPAGGMEHQNQYL